MFVCDHVKVELAVTPDAHIASQGMAPFEKHESRGWSITRVSMEDLLSRLAVTVTPPNEGVVVVNQKQAARQEQIVAEIRQHHEKVPWGTFYLEAPPGLWKHSA